MVSGVLGGVEEGKVGEGVVGLWRGKRGRRSSCGRVNTSNDK